MNKVQELQKIASEIEKCKICKVGKSGRAVPGEGNPDAKIMFLGEAPGKNEALTGRPFIGRSGKLLRQALKDVGLREEDVYITSPVKYLPDRGTPTVKDIEHGKIHFQKQLDVINPKVIVLLGNSACIAMLGTKVPILKRHGEVINEEGRIFLITFHPSAVLRFPNKYKKDFTEDLKKIEGLA